MPRLSPDRNPYGESGLYAVLRVKKTATAVELREAQVERIDELNHDTQLSEAERIKRTKEVKDAYEKVSDTVERATMDMFTIDESLGVDECVKSAKKYKDFTFDYNPILTVAEEVAPATLDFAKALEERRKVGIWQNYITLRPIQEASSTSRKSAVALITFDT